MGLPRSTAASESVRVRRPRAPAKPLKIIPRKFGSGSSDKNHSDSSEASSPVAANAICYAVPTPPMTPFNPAFEPVPEGK
ncbi:hypothetical protein FRC01_007904, partial [Tulasnella sp. 417]